MAKSFCKLKGLLFQAHSFRSVQETLHEEKRNNKTNKRGCQASYQRSHTDQCWSWVYSSNEWFHQHHRCSNSPRLGSWPSTAQGRCGPGMCTQAQRPVMHFFRNIQK